jgi:PAS domain S-box-containing protein
VIDDEIARYLLRARLGAGRSAVAEADGGEEGLRRARQVRPRVAVLSKGSAESRDAAGRQVREALAAAGLGAAIGGRTMPEQSVRVLVVDDDEKKRYTIARTLQRAGFAVVEGTTGAEGLRKAAEVALVVLDVKLPDIDGYEVCRRLKADPATASVPVLLASATFVGPDSQVQGLESGADAYLADAAEPPVLVATARALIRMRRAEEKARSLAREWETTFDAITDAVFLADPTGRVVRCNRALSELVGRPAGELVGSPVAGLHPAVPVGVDSPLARALRDRRRETAEAECGGRWFRLTVDPVPGPCGVPAGAVGILADVTAARRAEETLREADRRKDEFLAMLAHELRNPLAPLRNALHLQEQPGADPAAVDRSRAVIARQLGNMVRLIDDLLDVSRITRGKIDLKRQRVELGAILDGAVETSLPLVHASRHELTREGPSEPIHLDADPTRLTQVFANLLNNAAKYTPEGGRIRLEARREGDEAVVVVADNGSGIAPEMLERIWEPFAQADRTLGRAQGGLGIGLTLVKRLAELHGGSIRARSAGLGKGSEFTVRLPAAKGPAAATPATGSAPAVGVAVRRVLVVDDNTDAAESLATLVEMWGHEVRSAHDGPAALAAAEEFRPDVILLDIGLPGLTGYEVAGRLRARPEFQSVRLIALTGWGQDADRERSRAAGFELHLVKPVDPTELKKILSPDAE